MAKLPPHAVSVKRALSSDRLHRLSPLAEKLLVGTPPLVAMWRTLEKRAIGDDDDLWVWAFLETAADAIDLPPYHYLPVRARRKLIETITGSASNLAKMLEENRLDGHLIHSNGKFFNGFFLYEDFGESNRARIDDAGTERVKLSVLIQEIAERAQKKITEEPLHGKSGRNVRAIRFVRLIRERNMRWYGEPLNAVTAAAANAIFGTSYEESDIRKLVSR